MWPPWLWACVAGSSDVRSRSATSIATSSASTMLARRGHDSRRADDRRDRGEHAADLLGVDADLVCRSEVHQVRDRRGIDGDERGDANEHERLLIEARRVERGCRHVLEQVEDRGVTVGWAMVLPFVVGTAVSRAGTRSRSGARSCRRTARAGCRGAGSGTSPCPRSVWIQLPSGLSAGRSGPNVMVVEPSAFAVAAGVG